MEKNVNYSTRIQLNKKKYIVVYTRDGLFQML